MNQLLNAYQGIAMAISSTGAIMFVFGAIGILICHLYGNFKYDKAILLFCALSLVICFISMIAATWLVELKYILK